MQDFAVIDYSGGLLPNAAYHPGRNKSAQYLENCRVDDQGWLIPRKGYIRVNDTQGVSHVYAHRGFVFIIHNGFLRYGRVPDTISDSEALAIAFSGSLAPIETEGVIRFFNYEHYIYITSDPPLLIDLETGTPVVRPFRLPKLPDDLFDITVENESESGDEVSLRAQAVSLDADGNIIAVGPISDELVYVKTFTERSIPITRSFTVFRIKDRTEDRDASELTAVSAEIAAIDQRLVNDGVTHIQLFTTRPDDPTTEIDLISVALPVAYEAENVINFAYGDRIDTAESDYTEAGDAVAFDYMASDDFRNYVADAESNQIYLSYYDPAQNITLRQNFTDVIPLSLDGSKITGLHLLRDGFLYVYTTNQIKVIATDPVAELHRVVDYIKPRDDKGEIIGCAAPETIVNILGRHFFLATNKRVYRFDGQRLIDVSDRVHSEFQKVLGGTEDGEIQLQDAIGYSYDENYTLSVNMLGRPNTGKPNTLMVYDSKHGVWWKDTYGLHQVSKGGYDLVFGVIDNSLYLCHHSNTDDGEPIRRLWRSHPYPVTTQKTWESVHVHPLEPCRVDIKATTEQDEHVGFVDIENIAIFDAKRMGCNLRGLTQTVEIETESDATIHRIAINERVRNR